MFNWFSRGDSSFRLFRIDNKIRKAFSKVKKELEEHLDSINENTNEIQANYEQLLRLETKIDKIENSLSEINMFIKQYKSQNVYFIDEEQSSFNILPLTSKEKRVFQLIHELEAEQVKITYDILADMLNLSNSMAREYVMGLIEKGVPIVKNYMHQKVYLCIEPRFRDIQTKKNIIGL